MISSKSLGWWLWIPALAPLGRNDQLQLLALQPPLARLIQPLHLRPIQARHIGFHRVADPRLQIGEMAIASREARQQIGIERELRRRIERIEPILLVDRLAQHEPPAAGALLE